MIKDLITVIIPCYNSEKYLDKCLSSALEQTYKNVEIICVDDKSKDNTYEILKGYAKKYDNIKVYQNEKNSGAGYSRNNALKKANGEYILFLDSDDYLDNNYIEQLYNTLKQENADIAICDIYFRFTNSFKDYRNIVCTGKLEKYDFINNDFAASPCNKLFKKELLEKSPFAEGIMNEDIPSILYALILADKIAYTEKVAYNYFQHNESVQNSKLNLKRLDLFKAVDLLYDRVKDNLEQEKYFDAILFNQVIRFLIYVIPKESDRKTRKKILKETYKYTKKYNLLNNHELKNFYNMHGKKYKIYFGLYLKFYDLKMFNMMNLLVDFEHFYKTKLTKNVVKKSSLDDLIKMAKKQASYPDFDISISVVIPNYNYERFLYQRLYSILSQEVKINEIIILDDLSTDNSRILIDEIVDNLKDIINIKKVYNDKNSGSAFKQWEKGFNLTTSDYVWIAEADDYCSSKMLKELVKPILKDKNIVISYANTAFIDKDGFVTIKSIVNEIDIQKTGHWNKNYINNGVDEFNNYEYLNCTIANGSSVLFKKANYQKYFKISVDYKQCGDWLFYANVMRDGNVAYTKKALNYYRVHGMNVTSVTKKEAHMREIKKVHNFYDTNYGLNEEQKKNIQKRYEFLYDLWNIDKDKV